MQQAAGNKPQVLLHNRFDDKPTSRLVRNLLTAAANNREDIQLVNQPMANKSPPPMPAYSSADHNRAMPRRPQSANLTRRRSKNSMAPSRPLPPGAAIEPDRSSKANKEDLLNEVLELKKQILIQDDAMSALRSENQRLLEEGRRQERRIDSLLALAEGSGKGPGTGTGMGAAGSLQLRKDIEKSVIVRHLKAQLGHARQLVAAKDQELDVTRRETRYNQVKEIEADRDELSLEVNRLSHEVSSLQSDLARERQRREWGSRLAGDRGEELRKELARLASGYSHILMNLAQRGGGGGGGAGSNRPATAGHQRSSQPAHHHTHTQPVVPEQQQQQPLSLQAMQQQTPATTTSHQRRPKSASHVRPQPPPPPVAVVNKREESLESLGGGGAEFLLDKSLLLTDPNDNTNTNDGDSESQSNLSRKGVVLNTSFRPIVMMQQQPHQAQPQQLYHSNIAPLPPLANFVIKQQTPVAMLKAPSHALYKVGDKVLCDYHGQGKPYQGTIKAVNGLPSNNDSDSIVAVYRVVYDDEEEEANIPEARLTPIVIDTNHSQPQQSPPDSKAQPLYKAGDVIEARYYNGQSWYKGKIRSSSSSSSSSGSGGVVYEVDYEDGEREKGVLETNIRYCQPGVASVSSSSTNATRSTSPTPPAPQAATESLETAVQAPTTTTTATTTTATTSATAKQPLQRQQPEPIPVTCTSGPKPAYAIGSKVEGNYGKSDQWFSATITNHTLDKTINKYIYHLHYDDGDEEDDVDSTCIRPPPVAADSNGFKVGDKVEGYFEDFHAWFAGVIIAINNNSDSYHVKYDDGDEELSVPFDRLRKKALSVRRERYAKGDRVEARYAGDIAWFPGYIHQENKDKDKAEGVYYTYHIKYDDGDEELKVRADLIRLYEMEGSRPMSRVVSDALLPPNTNTATAAAAISAPATKPAATAAAPAAVVVKKAGDLDSMLADLSDDEDDDNVVGGLDSGPAMTIIAGDGTAIVMQQAESVNKSGGNDLDSQEHFDA